MVYLAELVGRVAFEIDHQATTKVIFYFDHVTNELTRLPSDKFFGQGRPFFVVTEVLGTRLLQHLSQAIMCYLLLKVNGKDYVLNVLQQLCKTGHVERDGLGEVRCTVHRL